MTHEIQASEVETRFPELLDAVERGEEIAITREGRRIARVIPETERRQQEIKAALADLQAIGREVQARNGPISDEDIVSSIHEGHKY